LQVGEPLGDGLDGVKHLRRFGMGFPAHRRQISGSEEKARRFRTERSKIADGLLASALNRIAKFEAGPISRPLNQASLL
jgi:hypothetical protein